MTIDIARRLTGNGRAAAAAPLRPGLVGLLAFLTLVDLFATQALLPMLAEAYGASAAGASLAVNATTFGMAVGSLAAAFAARRFDRRAAIVASLALLSIPTLLLCVAPGLAAFAALRVAQGLCMACAFTMTLAYIGENFGAASVGLFAAYATGNVASNLFGRLLAAAFADHFGLSASFAVFAALNLAGAGLAALLPREGVGAPPPPRASARPAAFTRGGASLALAFGVGFCILFAFIGVFSFVNFVLARPPFGLGMMSLGLVYLVFLPSLATTPLAGSAVARWGTRAPLQLGLSVAGAGLACLATPSLALAALGLALVAVGAFFAQAVATGFVGRAGGGASGFYLASYFAGGLAGSAVLGAVFDAFGWGACLVGVAVALALAAALAAGLDP